MTVAKGFPGKRINALTRGTIARYCNKLAENFEEILNSETALESRCIADVAFGQVLLPVVLHTVAKIDTSALYSSLPRDVKAAFELNLLERLAFHSTYSLFAEFSRLRSTRVMFFSPDAFEETDKSLYLEFVDEMHRGKFCEFLEQYSELDRCLGEICTNWTDSTLELLARLSADKQTISDELFAGRPLGALKSVRPSFSDPHNQGRTVVLLEFDGGEAVVYKPRDCSSDVNYACLVEWFSERGARLKAVRTVNRSGYGWAEMAIKTECKSLDDVNRYYENSGYLLCLVYALRGIDIHFENVMAVADMPVLIDTETLLYPDRDELMPGLELPPGYNRDSVFSTNFIPTKYTVDSCVSAKKVPDTSALGCSDFDAFELPLPVLVRVNTDSMYFEQKPTNELLFKLCPPKMNSQVIFDGKIQNFREFKEQILNGFEAMYGLILEHRQELLASDSPLAAFNRQRIRALYRPTRTYTCLLQLASRSSLMRDSGERRRFLEETLTGVIKDCPDKLKPLIKLETDSLADHLDVPFFSLESSDLNPEAWTALRTSCFDGMLSRIESLSSTGLQQQLDQITEGCS